MKAPKKNVSILWCPAQIWHSKLIYSLTEWEDPITAFWSITQRGFQEAMNPTPTQHSQCSQI